MQIFDPNIEPNIGANIRYITKYTKARYVQKKIRRDLYEAFIKWCGEDSINVCIEKALRIFGANIDPNIVPNTGANTARSSTSASSARAFVPDIDPNIGTNIEPNIGTNEAGSKAGHQDPSDKPTGVSPRLADILKQIVEKLSDLDERVRIIEHVHWGRAYINRAVEVYEASDIPEELKSAEPVEVAKGDGVEVYVYEVREGA
jgi:hypothetical protein